MDLGKNLVNLAFAPVRAGVAVAEVGLDIAGSVLDRARKTADGASRQAAPVVLQTLGLGDTVDGVNKVARVANELLDDDAPLGRAMAPGGSLDRLLRPGGLLDRISEPGGLADRLTEEGGTLERALKPGGLLDRLLAKDGLLERLLADDGLADRLLAEEGVIDKLTAQNGPLQQLADLTDTINRIGQGMQVLEPTVEALRDAVITLGSAINPLSNIADLIPRPGRSRRYSTRPTTSQHVIDDGD